MIPRLGVNIDHVATLRQQRGELYPSIVDAARACLSNGADQITIHLREDRRHIQDTDVGAVKLVCQEFGAPLNLEMALSDEIFQVALTCAPQWICLVPEKRQERTTEGGLNLLDEFQHLRILRFCEQVKSKLPKTKISLFLEADMATLEKTKGIPIDAVEIHTGDYAHGFLNNEDPAPFIRKYQEAVAFLKAANLGPHAGHGLTQDSVMPLLKAQLFTEYNIGHWIICEAVFKGLATVVKNLKETFHACD